MKSKLTLIISIVVSSMLLFACFPVSEQASIEIPCDDFQSIQHGIQHARNEIEVGVGASVTVTLCSNPTTGFEWSEQISEPNVLQQIQHEAVPPEAKGVPGAPGKEVWTFKALEQGICIVSMDYSRPWEGGEKGAWTYTLTVVVK